jgi:hypothetical protein
MLFSWPSIYYLIDYFILFIFVAIDLLSHQLFIISLIILFSWPSIYYLIEAFIFVAIDLLSH